MGATVSRRLAKLSVCLAIAWSSAHAVPAAPVAAPSVAPSAVSITFAEQPARLVRGKSLYRVGRGAGLQPDDMLESGSGTIQLDADGTTLAIGPATRIWIRSGSDIVLLDGWLKLQGRGGRAMTVSSSSLSLTGGAASLTMRVSGAMTTLFAEAGTVPVRELDAGKARRTVTVAPEQFASRSGAQPLRLAARPPPDFLAALPRDLRDVLVPLPAGGAAVVPRPERTLSFAELAPWVAGHGALRQQLQRRFEPPRPARAVLSTPSPVLH
jgi:hypothetical protein